MPDSPPTNCLNLVTWKLITTLCYSTNIIIYFNYYTFFNLYSFQNLGLQVENKLPIKLCRVMMQILRLWICLVWNFPFFLVTPLYFISPTVIFAALANTCDKNLQELGLQKKNFGDNAEINRQLNVYGKWEVQVEFFFSWGMSR